MHSALAGVVVCDVLLRFGTPLSSAELSTRNQVPALGLIKEDARRLALRTAIGVPWGVILFAAEEGTVCALRDMLWKV